MKTKLFSLLGIHVLILAFAQNLTFTDAKFKALILSSNSSNQIAMDFSGNYISIDQNGDGEIQVSEAENVKTLNIKMDESQKYLSDNISDINFPYYFDHLPDNITDALLFTNVENLLITDTKSADISFVNNTKIKSIKCEGRDYYNSAVPVDGSYEYSIFSVNFTIDNCSSISSFDDIVAHPEPLGANYVSDIPAVLHLKNMPQLTGDLVLDMPVFTEIYFENVSYDNIIINSNNVLKKLSVPNMSSLKTIKVDNQSSWYERDMDLVADNCTSLQEITFDGDYYDSYMAGLSSLSVNGCTALKKIKGLNFSTIDFSAAGLTSLEELDCAFYNRYTYYASSMGNIQFGNVTSVNLANLPSLKVFKAFNQSISSLNLANPPLLEYIDISNSIDNLALLDVSNYSNLKTLLSALYVPVNNDYFQFGLKKVLANDCPKLTVAELEGNNGLELINFNNCTSLETFKYDGGYNSLLEPDYSLNVASFLSCPALVNLRLVNNRIKTLDLSQSTSLQNLELFSSPKLSYLNIQNGSLESMVALDYGTTAQICADENQVQTLQSDYGGATITSSCSLANNDTMIKNKLVISPNPASDFITVKSDNKIVNILVIDNSGKLVKEFKINEGSEKLDISDLVKGLYYFKIKTSTSEEIVKKVIKN